MPTLRIDPALPVPLWSQIEDGLRRRIATGALAPGAAMPSVRELAAELRINPATVVRAYQRPDRRRQPRPGAAPGPSSPPRRPCPGVERQRALRRRRQRFADHGEASRRTHGKRLRRHALRVAPQSQG